MSESPTGAPHLPRLPVTTVLADLRAALVARGLAVLEAPPGAGKTTLVPLALLNEPWLGDGRIVMLEPRRLAARAAASRMAALLGEDVGDTVGYRIRLETRISSRTRVEVVTEGILTRMLQSDPALEGYAAVIFDEFHERNLPSDLGLALALESREALRPDLRILVMSATLDGAAVAALLGGAPRIQSQGRRFPVEVRYLTRVHDERVEDLAARHVRRALAEQQGDILVFLPGAAEIRRTHERLDGLDGGVDVYPLHGSLPGDIQDRAIRPSPPGRRKVVLATDIAETSLTIEGVRVVVDSGLARRPRFDPQRGMERLETVRIARDSAEQRRGRAGRLAPGICYRLWTAHQDALLAPRSRPEIQTADLAPLALELALWGASDPERLRWLDPPPQAAYASARELLHELDALDRGGHITPHGRQMAALGVHPRLAHLILVGRERGLGPTAARLAALLNDRDPLRTTPSGSLTADIRLRLDLLRAGNRHPDPHADRAAVARARREAALWQRRLRIPEEDPDPEAAGLLLALAYPERIAQLRAGEGLGYRLRSGQRATLAEGDPLAGTDYLAVAHFGGLGAQPRISLAAPVSRGALENLFADQIQVVEEVRWDDREGRVLARRQERLGALVLREAPLSDPAPGAVAAALLEGIRLRGLDVLPWDKETAQLRQRLAFLHRLDSSSWPDVSDASLLARADAWLSPHLHGLRRLDELPRIDLEEALLSELGWDQRLALEHLAPSHLTVPSGSRIRLDYSDPTAPVLAVRLQEVFGLTETPRIGGGRVPLTVHLLSPAHRPVQVTRDLESFWREAYFDVRKDLRGRYPKHHWPDDPLTAEPARGTRRR